ncbi:hypothetical protein MJO28_009238 [Puccinia striiformis f. sp. tritici]|uniref:Uncharacterized protein n=1 Tax=Puccinia striiformis f. sp. tritici TaxID=168172 RepID=A0ACC0E8M7_9BASI|nr:uncharacterized protein Pst134EA_031719 [Puccinia striiformis f. sp. tritici]XP_047804479.1 hypothetical protein Pst134EA_017832 [Puccinia striiformis f. sp. tritici]KAH9445188.1 hypothetical protein Pst134EA_031719 [Puccinia striiformis f. sp. tritici]KAH9461532.1 hypothetical protein Pst134EA_017832 [Puccinia striiformis f. sp. tritici]KAI7947330.1 hypothetical protein MJO28_009238 [Puccinia striiformis f. sp. tritici]
MIGPVILAILCHSAYLTLFTVILDAPAGVVAHPSPVFKEAEEVGQDARGVSFDFNRSGSRGNGLSFGVTSPITYRSGNIYNDVRAPREDTLHRTFYEDALFNFVKEKDEMVSEYRAKIDGKSYAELVNLLEKGRDPLSLEEITALDTAYREHLLEQPLFPPLRFYRRIFQKDQWKRDQLFLKLKKLRKISATVDPLEAQQAIKRLSILEYEGYDFSTEQGQLIEKLSEQADSMGSSRESIHFILDDEDKALINKITWKELVKKIDVKFTNEGTLFNLIKTKDETVSEYKANIDKYGYEEFVSLLEERHSPLSLGRIAQLETAYREHRLEKLWYLPLRLYRMIFKQEQWKQDQLYLKLKKLRKISWSVGGVIPLDAQLAIERLSILEHKGFNFSERQVQLIENLSKQAGSMGPLYNRYFELEAKDIALIEKIEWEKVIHDKIGEITLKMDIFKKIADTQNYEDARDIFEALKDMRLVMSYDTARWSSETSRLLENINNLETGGDNLKLILDEKDRKTMENLKLTRLRIYHEISPKKTPPAVDSANSQATEEVQTAQDGEDLEHRSEPSHSH